MAKRNEPYRYCIVESYYPVSTAGLHGPITFRRKAPTNTWTASAVELVNIHRGAVVNSVSLSAVAAGDLKIAFRVILRELLRR